MRLEPTARNRPASLQCEIASVERMGDRRTLIRCKACESSSEKKLLLQVVFRADEA